MVWRKWAASELSGGGAVPRARGTDWDEAATFLTSWTSVAVSTTVSNSLFVSGDGKYRVAFSAGDSLHHISGTSPGDVMIVFAALASVVSAGSGLTLVHSGSNDGNIRLNAGVNIVFTNPDQWAMLIHSPVSAVLTGGMMYGP